jgi:GNAT superfamily N-acetyltransferase
MEDRLRIRPARFDDVEIMQSIERAAGRLFADIGMDDIASDPPLPGEELAGFIRAGRAWIAELNGLAQGYALADVVDGHGHLEQVSVHPDAGRRGLGRALVQTVIEWATAEGFPRLTLLTFRDVPWNGPYYAALGFREVPDAALTPELLALRNREADLGLDRDARFAMSLSLSAGNSHTNASEG